MYAVDWGHVPAYMDVFQDPKLNKNPDVGVCTYSERNEASEAFKYRAETPNKHYPEPGVKAELKAVQPAMFIYKSEFIRSLTIERNTRNLLIIP